MRIAIATAGALAAFWSACSLAVNADGFDIPYAVVQFAQELPDSARDAEDGAGYQVSFGIPIREQLAFELSFYDVARERSGDGADDFQTAAMFNLVRSFDLGSAWFKPFVLAGVGVVEDDVLGDKDIHYGGNLGLGVLLKPFGEHGWALRAEARSQIHQNRTAVAGESSLTDSRLMIGLQLPLTPWFESKPKSGRDCGVAVVPASGRHDCGVDSDADGVSDGYDECPGSPPGSMVNRSGCPLTEGVVLRGVNFKTDSAVLLESSKRVLDEVAAALQTPSTLKMRIAISGHTDGAGDEDYNLELSAQRAESVRQYLIGRGIESGRMTADGQGEASPMASNATAQGRALNRRVEFRVLGQ